MNRVIFSLGLFLLSCSVKANDYLAIGLIDSQYATGFDVYLDPNDHNTIKGTIEMSYDQFMYYRRYCHATPDTIAKAWMSNGMVLLAERMVEAEHVQSKTIYYFDNPIQYPNSELDGQHIVFRNVGELWRFDASCQPGDGGPYGTWTTYRFPFELKHSSRLPTGSYNVRVKYAMFDIWTTQLGSAVSSSVLGVKNHLLNDLYTITGQATVPATCSLRTSTNLLLQHGDINIRNLNGNKSNKETITVDCNGVVDVTLNVYFLDTNNSTVVTSNGVSLSLLIDDNDSGGSSKKRISDLMGGAVSFDLSSIASKTDITKAGAWDVSAIAAIYYE